MTPPRAASTERDVLRVGAVPYLNAWPVTWGLGKLSNWATSSAVPSELATQLTSGAIDMALGSSIDAMRIDPAPIVLPAAPIASDGPTLTVKIASRVPAERLRALYCDTDSHTSVALATILLREVWGIDPVIESFDARCHKGDWPESVLLIGDKVITDPLPADTWAYDIDLAKCGLAQRACPLCLPCGCCIRHVRMKRTQYALCWIVNNAPTVCGSIDGGARRP